MKSETTEGPFAHISSGNLSRNSCIILHTQELVSRMGHVAVTTGSTGYLT